MSTELIEKLAVEHGWRLPDKNYMFSLLELEAFAKAYHAQQNQDALEYIAKMEKALKEAKENISYHEGKREANRIDLVLASKPASLKG